MAKTNTNQKTRMIKFLANGKEFTITELEQRLAIANPSAVVAELRGEGHVIWTNSRKDKKTGRRIFKYRYDATRSAQNLR